MSCTLSRLYTLITHLLHFLLNVDYIFLCGQNCYRTPEPHLSAYLLDHYRYVKCAEMAADAMAVVASGELELIPKIHEKTWNHWMTDIRDWCISRQLWWGHRIPAYYVTLQGDAEQVGTAGLSVEYRLTSYSVPTSVWSH